MHGRDVDIMGVVSYTLCNRYEFESDNGRKTKWAREVKAGNRRMVGNKARQQGHKE